jgi:hypothetical protein
MGIRYLWIDSLCIVQDDEKEWEVEAARMASIFENSYLTIAMHQTRPNASSVYNSDDITGSILITTPSKISSSWFPPTMRVTKAIHEDDHTSETDRTSRIEPQDPIPYS